ncbi:MAG: hypothetical protein KHY89_01635 [Butyricicoccus pullicaecorum]|nr:hypothetical protein [Butyricicoccus pullicaecorum]
MQILLSYSAIIFSGAFFFLVLPHASAAAQGVEEGLQIACSMAIPSLFPFFVLSGLLIRTGAVQKLGNWCAPLLRRLYGLPGESAGPLLLGLIGGYPIGAQAAYELYQAGTLSRTETEELLGFCNNTGPAFLVGVCGAGLCGSIKIGLFLYGIHIVTALLTGLLLPHHTAQHRQALHRSLPANVSFSASLVASAEQAGRSCLKITVFIMLFSMLRHVLEAAGVFTLAPMLCAPLLWFLGAPAAAAAPLLTGLLEMTSGLVLLPESCGHALLPAMSMLVGFGGCSVLCQTTAVMNGLSVRRVLYGKALHGLLAAALTILCQAAFPISIPTFSPYPIPSTGKPAIGFIFFIYSLFCVIFSGKKHHIPL